MSPQTTKKLQQTCSAVNRAWRYQSTYKCRLYYFIFKIPYCYSILYYISLVLPLLLIPSRALAVDPLLSDSGAPIRRGEALRSLLYRPQASSHESQTISYEVSRTSSKSQEGIKSKGNIIESLIPTRYNNQYYIQLTTFLHGSVSPNPVYGVSELLQAYLFFNDTTFFSTGDRVSKTDSNCKYFKYTYIYIWYVW